MAQELQEHSVAPDETVAAQLQRLRALQKRAVAPEAPVAASRRVEMQRLGALHERCKRP